ncbi:MAG: NAD(P)H-dependent oxidoreductase [Acidobacteria bacterium]|nr:NAD(P)H-dependent oxidoreductase [Acidobacteriota bacterium]
MANIRIVAMLGSSRPGNATGKALAVTVDELRKDGDVSVDVIDPAGLDLRAPGFQNADVVKALQEKVTAATGMIFATPEYHGSYSSVIKMLIEHLGFPSTLSGKPVALLGVAAGAIGAIKSLEHLRSVCSHVGGIVLPGPVSVAGVHKVFDEEGNCLDPSAEKRLRGLGRNLTDYIRQNICPRVALEQMVREPD